MDGWVGGWLGWDRCVYDANSQIFQLSQVKESIPINSLNMILIEVPAKQSKNFMRFNYYAVCNKCCLFYSQPLQVQ